MIEHHGEVECIAPPEPDIRPHARQPPAAKLGFHERLHPFDDQLARMGTRIASSKAASAWDVVENIDTLSLPPM